MLYLRFYTLLNRLWWVRIFNLFVGVGQICGRGWWDVVWVEVEFKVWKWVCGLGLLLYAHRDLFISNIGREKDKKINDWFWDLGTFPKRKQWNFTHFNENPLSFVNFTIISTLFLSFLYFKTIHTHSYTWMKLPNSPSTSMFDFCRYLF